MLKGLSILGYAGMVGGLLGQLAVRNVFSASPAVITVQAGAFLLMLWARRTFGRRSFHLAANLTGGSLVTSGPYRYLRHPIYSAVCLFIGAGAAAHWSWSAGWSWRGPCSASFARNLWWRRGIPSMLNTKPRLGA